MSQDVKRWLYQCGCIPKLNNGQYIVTAKDHDRIVAELKAEVDHLNRQLADAMSGCCDCPMFKAQGKTVAELKAENDILKSKASQFESTLKETMRVRDAEIEKLKRVVDVLKIQRCRLLSEKFAGFPLNAMNAESELDAEIDAIEKGEA